MAPYKDVLVSTTNSIEGLKIKQYLRPVSAHIVAGTNIFSDFMASFSDVFGGRSHTYQKQLTSVYHEAVARIKIAAFELGANCVVGLSIDMDEISGKGKSMFMLTAVGTAVILEKDVSEKNALPKSDEKLENVDVDRINILRNKKSIIAKANANKLVLDEETWNFITANQVSEVYPYLLTDFAGRLAYEQNNPEAVPNFYKLFSTYIDALPENTKIALLYGSIEKESNERVVNYLLDIIKDLHLFDLGRSIQLLQNGDFQKRKLGLRITTYDKPFYNRQDKLDLQTVRDLIKTTFKKRGTRTMKKQLLSSKEKEVWVCECGKTNDIDEYCSGCSQDIYGFKANEVKPNAVDNYIGQKIELIGEYVG